MPTYKMPKLAKTKKLGRKKVLLVANGDLSLYLPRGGRRCLSAKIVYQSPIRPPVVQGDKIAQVRVYCGDKLIQSAPLFAAKSVKEGSLVRKSIDALKQLALGWL